MKKGIFLFQRDLRIQDNTAIMQMIQDGYKIIPLFILDPAQVEAHAYFSEPALWFMKNSLSELAADVARNGGKLYFEYGPAEKIILQFMEETGSSDLFYNRDYTPFSRERWERISRLVKQSGNKIHECCDLLLNEPETILTNDGKPYSVFTPYFRKCRMYPFVHKSSYDCKNIFADFSEGKGIELLDKIRPVAPVNPHWIGGRREALGRLKKIESLVDYTNTRDFPAMDGTSDISAHLKFGTISIREVYAAIAEYHGESHPLIRQLYWRDFFTQIAWYYPAVFGESFHKEYDDIVWGNSSEKFARWCAGETGFPIVDAGMRQLNETGYMHNRVRMIAASFLVKDLHVDWRKGEKYFASKLMDYDPAVNNGNWQWAASTGCDAQPWFRIFNPWLQQKKFDKDSLYIKKWIPELKDVESSFINNLYETEDRKFLIKDYPLPVCDHSVESRTSKSIYKNTLLLKHEVNSDNKKIKLDVIQ